MARSGKPFSRLFLPLSAQSARTRRPSPAIDDNPSIQAIWDVVCTIPRGQVSTYGAVARAAGLPGRARLTGFALRMRAKGHQSPLASCGRRRRTHRVSAVIRRA